MSFRLLAALPLLLVLAHAQPEFQTLDFNADWRFSPGDLTAAQLPEFDDAGWKQVDLPHDWSIAGPYDRQNPAYSRGAWLPTGICYYRKHFVVPEGAAGKKVLVYFGGIYRHSTVWLNGRYLGYRPSGYASFAYDLTPHLQSTNVLTVRVDNSRQPGSRWYSGTGIYRDVKLLIRDRLSIPLWGTAVTTPVVEDERTEVRVVSTVANDRDRAESFTIGVEVRDADGRHLAATSQAGSLSAGAAEPFRLGVTLARPHRWSPAHPYLYRVHVSVSQEGKVVHTEEWPLGVRLLDYSANDGFRLNGDKLTLQGVCLHHDGGALGAAVLPATLDRQLRLMKRMGANAVRTAHNPMSDEFMDACDRLGLLVLNEAFDEWQVAKATPDYDERGKRLTHLMAYYADDFDAWAERDLVDMVRRDRNHPSVFMWSLGNEIAQTQDASGIGIARRLNALVHELDDRPTTIACNGYPGLVNPSYSEVIEAADVQGLNYAKSEQLTHEHARWPERKMIITECASAQPKIPRGEYDLTPDLTGARADDDTDAGSGRGKPKYLAFDSGIAAWRAVVDHPNVMGAFIWTGTDYLGETTPYPWPARAAFYGPVDLCGFPKDGFYYYQSQWSSRPMVHLFPHWNWSGAEGREIQVGCFSNCATVELLLNGRPIEKKPVKRHDVTVFAVPYEKGELKAVGYSNVGKRLAEIVVRTAGPAARISLTSDRPVLRSARDLWYVECSITDAAGTLVPTADQQIKFSVEGPGRIAGVENGNQRSVEPAQADTRHAFNGRCLAIVRCDGKRGLLTVTASAPGLADASLTLAVE